MYYSLLMTTYSLRSDPDLDAALDQLGATPGNRSRVIREAVLALATWQKSVGPPVSLLVRDYSAIAQMQRDLDSVKLRLNKLVGGRGE